MKFDYRMFLAKNFSNLLFKFRKFDQRSRVLMYHSFEENAYKDYKNLYSLKKNIFIEQLTYLINNKYRIIKINKIKYQPKEILFTFDDGYESLNSFIEPIFNKFNIPFTVFLSPKFIESNDSRFINKKKLFKMSLNNNIDIGAHGFNHIDLSNLNYNELKSEVFDSKKYIEDIIGREVKYFSYPYGKININCERLFRELGFVAAFTSKIGTINKDSNKYMLNRTDILSYDNFSSFKQKINGSWDWINFFLKK